MWPRNNALDYPATPLIFDYDHNGCPVDCSEYWTLKKITLMLQRGPHVSYKDTEATCQLQAETLDKCKNQYAEVVRFGDIQNKLPTKLKISPVAMIPHKSKAYICILDLSLQLHLKQKQLESVNTQTNKRSKAEAMVQLGLALWRLIPTMVDHHDPDLPFL